MDKYFEELMKKIENKDKFISVSVDSGGITMRHIVDSSELFLNEYEISIESGNLSVTIPIDGFKIEKANDDLEEGYELTCEAAQICVDFI